jgi:hypothetical protein
VVLPLERDEGVHGPQRLGIARRDPHLAAAR